MLKPRGISVGVADDHPIVRTGLRDLLSSIEGLHVVGEASSGVEAVELALQHRPDVMVMGLERPELDGIAATREIVRAAPGVAILVLTTLDGDDAVLSAVRAGARGYLLKGAPQDDIVHAIRSVATGAAFFGRSVADRIADLLTIPVPAKAFPNLTQRELEVLDLIATGIGNAVIARQLQVAPKTVSNHISNIFAKLGAKNRSQAITRARTAGLGRQYA